MRTDPGQAHHSCRQPATAFDRSSREEAWTFLRLLERRHSVGPRHLGLPAPSAHHLEEAAATALRAPDHRHLRPFRFVQIADEQRGLLGNMFAADAARRGHSAAEIERARERARNGPALLAAVAHVRENVEDVPLHEQWITVGAGLMNFLNGLHALGFGAKLLSGASVRDPAIEAAFCGRGERLVCWIVAGTATRRPTPKYVEQEASVLTPWAPPGR